MNDRHTVMVDHIPVLWCEPHAGRSSRQLIAFLTHLGGTKEQTIPFLRDIAAAGFVALSFDPWQHGERGTESQEALMRRVFGNFRRHMWPILGQTTLDTLRVIDWAVATLDVEPHVSMGGISMGGDIAVAAAGIDHRIEKVAAVVATPDWLRPGMHDAFTPGKGLPPGDPDAYAQYFFDRLNPLSHVPSYAHGPSISFVCGGKDVHVPPDGARRFQAALREKYRAAADGVQIQIIADMGHLDALKTDLWWPGCLAWLTRE